MTQYSQIFLFTLWYNALLGVIKLCQEDFLSVSRKRAFKYKIV